MDDRQRSRLAFHGIAVFVAGLALGVPFAMVFTKPDDPHTHLWSVAHLQALTHGLLLIGFAAIGKYVTLSRRSNAIAVPLLITGAYATIAGATVSAIWDVLGLEPGGGPANTVSWILHGYGTAAVCAAVVWVGVGSYRAMRTVQGETTVATRVIEIPQFGSGPRTPVVLEVADWSNWGRTQHAQPVRIERPQSIDDLRSAVRRAVQEGYRVKAVGGGYSWSAGAVTDGVLIDLSNLNRVIGIDAGTEHGPATITVESGTTVHQLSEAAASHGLTLRTTTVIPWVSVGGAVANGCHGSGRDVATFSDQVCAIDIVGADGALTTHRRDDSDEWRALVVSLGAMGVIYSLTFECVPDYSVRACDRIVSIGDVDASMAQWYQDNEALEVFWFPFNDRALVKTWNASDDPVSEHLPRRAWDDLTQAFEQGLSHLMKRTLEEDPSLTPSLCRLMFSMMPKLDVVCPARWAMQYQTSFAPVIDTSYAIPIDADLSSVRAAWAAGVNLVDTWARNGRYPQNMVLHARFVGEPSTALLSPTEGHQHGSCLIEALTFEQTTGYEEFFAELGTAWQALGGRPHWAKLVYAPTDFRALYGENLDRFEAVRARRDPDGVFLNDFLTRIVGPSR